MRKGPSTALLLVAAALGAGTALAATSPPSSPNVNCGPACLGGGGTTTTTPPPTTTTSTPPPPPTTTTSVTTTPATTTAPAQNSMCGSESPTQCDQESLYGYGGGQVSGAPLGSSSFVFDSQGVHQCSWAWGYAKWNSKLTGKELFEVEGAVRVCYQPLTNYIVSVSGGYVQDLYAFHPFWSWDGDSATHWWYGPIGHNVNLAQAQMTTSYTGCPLYLPVACVKEVVTMMFTLMPPTYSTLNHYD